MSTPTRTTFRASSLALLGLLAACQNTAEPTLEPDPAPEYVPAPVARADAEHYALELTLDLARVFSAQLVRHDVPETRIVVGGRGGSAPLTSNDLPEGQDANERIDVILAVPPETLRLSGISPCFGQRPERTQSLNGAHAPSTSADSGASYF